MGVDQALRGGGIRVIEGDDMVVGEVIAGSEHGEPAMELLDDGGPAGRIHLAVGGAHRAAAGEAFPDAVDIPLVDGEAIACHELANFGARLQPLDPAGQGPCIARVYSCSWIRSWLLKGVTTRTL